MVLNIYYPQDLLDGSLYQDNEKYIVLGYTDKEGNYAVVTTIPFVSKIELSNILKHGTHDYELDVDISDQNNQVKSNTIKLFVLGSINFQLDPQLLEFKYNIKLKFPEIINNGIAVNFLVYEPPDSLKMEYFSMHALALDLTSAEDDNVEKDDYKQKIMFHGKLYHESRQEQDIYFLLHIINSIDYLRYVIYKKIGEQVKPYNIKKHNKNKLVNRILNNKYMENSLFFLQKISQNTINPIIVVVIITLKIVFEILLKILNYEFIKNKNLVTISTFCFQLDLRLQYICNFPVQFMAIKQKTVSLVSKPSLPSYDSSLEYIRFYNSLWLVFNDILLAVLIRPYLIYFKDIITNFLKEQIIDTLLYKDILMLLRWLMDNPAGFKLNYELSNFLGGLYIWAIQFWYQEFILKLFDLKMLRLFFATIINLGKIGGMTFTISFLLDFINIICFHIYSFNFSSTRIYNWQLNIIKSLFKLFYGKKYNILRNRIDSNNYDFDQLLLGIIIFTVLIYLLPTVVAFYVSFFALKVAIFLLVDLLQCTMLIINHFPIFLVLLKLKNSKRLPAGITFDIIDNHNTTTIIKMTSKTISLEKLFHYFSELIISSNTSNVNIFEDFIFTKFLGGDLINNIEYEKIYQKFKRINLPPSEKRIGVKELWDKLIDGYIRNDQNYDKSNKKIL